MINSDHCSQPPEQDDKILLFGNRFFKIFPNGVEFYICNEFGYLFHREDEPAIYQENAGEVYEGYYSHGDLHREDGPAEIYHCNIPFNFYNGIGTVGRISEYLNYADRCYFSWFWKDQKLEFKEWLEHINLSDNERALLLLKYG